MKTKPELEKIDEFTYNVNVKLGDVDYSIDFVTENGENYAKFQQWDSDEKFFIPLYDLDKFVNALNKFKEINNL